MQQIELSVQNLNTVTEDAAPSNEIPDHSRCSGTVTRARGIRLDGSTVAGRAACMGTSTHIDPICAAWEKSLERTSTSEDTSIMDHDS
jgi:hypothetical protein